MKKIFLIFCIISSFMLLSNCDKDDGASGTVDILSYDVSAIKMNTKYENTISVLIRNNKNRQVAVSVKIKIKNIGEVKTINKIINKGESSVFNRKIDTDYKLTKDDIEEIKLNITVGDS